VAGACDHHSLLVAVRSSLKARYVNEFLSVRRSKHAGRRSVGGHTSDLPRRPPTPRREFYILQVGSAPHGCRAGRRRRRTPAERTFDAGGRDRDIVRRSDGDRVIARKRCRSLWLLSACDFCYTRRQGTNDIRRPRLASLHPRIARLLGLILIRCKKFLSRVCIESRERKQEHSRMGRIRDSSVRGCEWVRRCVRGAVMLPTPITENRFSWKFVVHLYTLISKTLIV